jgi:hypothetical protein
MGLAIAEANNVPGQITRSPESVQKIRQGRQMAQQEQAQQEQAQSMLGGVKAISEADRNSGGKLSQAMAGAMSGAAGPGGGEVMPNV